MITLDALRSALLSDQPHTKLDELVRAELAAGRLTQEIYKELDALEESVRATPGFGDDADEALRDTMDALNGFCPAEVAYKNSAVLPREEEIAMLPRWARVAFAARCVRRVFPNYAAKWPQGSSHALIERQTLIECEESARSGRVQHSQKRVSYGTVFAGMPRAAAAIAGAVGEVYFLTLAQGNDVPGVLRVLNGLRIEFEPVLDLWPYFRRDFEQIAKLAESHHWTDDSPVPPDAFGPLWPEGSPADWPANPEVLPRSDLSLEVLSNARDLERMTEDDVVNLFNAINAYYIARTGHRLTMEDLQPRVAAGVPAEV